MTVGRHDDAWLDVMRNRVPNIDHNLMCLAKYTRLHTELELIKECLDNGLCTNDEYKKMLEEIAEQAGYVVKE
jgi:hypothetical protein